MTLPSLLVAGLLFFVLSPGVLLTIPPGSRGLFFSGQTSVLAALVHAVVFVAVAYLLSTAVEGFTPNTNIPTNAVATANMNANANMPPLTPYMNNPMREGYRNRY
jgi:hypothetical protein